MSVKPHTPTDAADISASPTCPRTIVMSAEPACEEPESSGDPNDVEESERREVWPVYSGRSFNLWEPDTGEYYDSVDAESIRSHLYEKRLSQRQVGSSAFSELPESFTNNPQTLPCLHSRIAFRDVTRANDTRTLRAALVPPRRAITNQAPYLVQTAGKPADEAYVLGVFSSMIFDWQMRRTVELHVTFKLLNQASVPDPGAGHPLRDRVVYIAGRLAAVDVRFADWARRIGVPVGSVIRDEQEAGESRLDAEARLEDGDPDELVEQEVLEVELDACVALLYGLDCDDVTVLYDTFGKPGQWDERRDAVIAAMGEMSESTECEP